MEQEDDVMFMTLEERQAVERAAREASLAATLQRNISKRRLKSWLIVIGIELAYVALGILSIQYVVDLAVYWATGAEITQGVRVPGCFCGAAAGIVLFLISRLRCCQEMGGHFQIGHYLKVPYKVLTVMAVVAGFYIMILLTVHGQAMTTGVMQSDISLVANATSFLLTFVLFVVVIFATVAVMLPDGNDIVQEEKRKLGIPG